MTSTRPGPQDRLQEAIALHQRGQLADAQSLYEDILRRQPRHFDGLHLLGLSLVQAGKPALGVDLMRRALDVDPQSAAAHNNLGAALVDLGRLDEALASYDGALALRPDYAEAHRNRGNVLRRLGRRDEALASYERAVSLRPDYAEGHCSRGNALHDAGRFGEALASYDRALALKPGFADAHNNRGNALSELARLEEALASYDQALALRPDHAEAHANRGAVLHRLGRREDAVASYDRALALTPDHADVHEHRAATLLELGRLDEALASYDRALALQPDRADTWNNRGKVLRQLSRAQQAVASYDRALGLKPGSVEAHFNRGNALSDLGHLDTALASYDRALALQPDHAASHTNRGNALMRLERFEAALASYEHALDLQPQHAEALSNRGNALRRLGRPAEALASYDRALALKPGYADAHSNRGTALLDLGRLDEALASLDRALDLEPEHADACNSRGRALLELGRPEEALASYERALAVHPDDDVRLNRAMLLLLTGRWDSAWPDYEHRRRSTDAARARLTPQTALTSLAGVAGTTVLVHWEQGLGDTLQFCRYAPLLAERGAKVLLAPQKGLQALMRSLGGGVTIVDLEDRSLAFDRHVRLMSLPSLFATSPQTVPCEVPYLAAEPERVRRWGRRIGTHGLRIGICWKGSSGYSGDAARSFDVRCFEPIARIAGVRLISLHKGDGEVQLGSLPEGMIVETLGDDFDPGPDAFLDTAAAMKGLDLVITSDTAIAHLAGALGVPTWIVLRHVPDWRWLLGRSDSPWYPSARLFRQEGRGDWAGVFARIAAEARAWLESSSVAQSFATPTVMVSWGELIDKVTILQIKTRRLATPGAVENARRELNHLSLVAEPALRSSAQIRSRAQALLEINETLWQIEDRIREKEAAGLFDREFVELARSVYRTNDRRAALKREINTLLSSELIEEKSYR